MGDHNISLESRQQNAQAFMRALLSDLAALEQMIESNQIEADVRRIGAEQEMFLVDSAMRPAPVAMEVLKCAAEPRLTTEIGRFNLEANLAPRALSDNCFSAMQREISEVLGIARQAARACGADVLLTGILPTLSKTDLTIDNLTPNPRYEEMNRVITRMRGGAFNVHLKGLDELQLTHDNMLLEACCTSFQVHLQAGAAEFAQLYNLAQLITAPILAAATNSPLLLGHRLWHETRIALFQHSADERSSTHQLRNRPTRVSFGENWIKDSVLEIFREEIARFRVMITKPITEDSLAVLSRGELPMLDALRLHNGTVWRWNRPCYGVMDGKAHLRIEMRALPSGPTISDEVANAAFALGLMLALPTEYGDIRQQMPFDDARNNFLAAARQGLRTQFTWLKGKNISAASLILEHLLPLARIGLRQANVATSDISHYLDIIEERVRSEQTGSLWALRSFAAMGETATREERLHALTATMLKQQQTQQPIHEWPLAKLSSARDWRLNFQTVGQFMSTDLFTVRPDDLVDLVASVMDWKHIRHIPVEDDDGRLHGLVSHRDLLRLLARRQTDRRVEAIAVKDIMIPHPVTVSPTTNTLEAIRLMRRHNIGCLPVISEDRLVGILTAQDFLSISADLIESQLEGSKLNPN